MKRLVWFCGLLVLLAGFGGSGRSGGVSVTVTVHSLKVAPGGKHDAAGRPLHAHVRPAGRDAPVRERGSAPTSAPIRSRPSTRRRRGRSASGGRAPRPTVPGTFPYGIEVRAVVDGKTSVFGDDRPRECDWPVGWSAGLYRAAVANDARGLAASEAKLGCVEDPALLAQPHAVDARLPLHGLAAVGGGDRTRRRCCSAAIRGSRRACAGR